MTGDANRSYRIEPLGPQHDRSSLSSGVAALDNYLQKQARQDFDRNLATVFVLTADGTSLAGFYAVSACSISGSDLPVAYAKKLPRLPIPATLLGRMAVSTSLQGRGLGEVLLMSAFKRILAGSQQIASWAVVVDAKLGARNFYLKYGFVPLLDNENRLFLSIRDVAKLFSR